MFDAWGHEIAKTGIEEGVIYGEIDPDESDEIKKQLLWQSLKRDDLYSVVNKVNS